MSMTKKDYEALANAVRTALYEEPDQWQGDELSKSECRDMNEDTLSSFVYHLMPYLKAANPLFDAFRFERACFPSRSTCSDCGHGFTEEATECEYCGETLGSDPDCE